MARCQPFSTTLSGRRNAATMPCFPPARGTCSTRRTVRVPVRLGLRRPLGCRPPTAGFPASQLALRGVTVPWLSRRKVARPPAGNAETHCHACERLIALTPADYSLPSRLTASFRGHGCYTVLSPRGLPQSPLGYSVADRQLLPVRLRSLPPYPLFLAESEGRPGVPVARLSLPRWSTCQPFGRRSGDGAGDSVPTLLEAVNLLIL